MASTSEAAGFAVTALGLAEFFDCVCGKGEGDRPKPHPDVFLNALRKLGMSADRCLVVEDTPVGAQAALRAGTQVIVRAADPLAGQEFPDGVIGTFATYAELHAGLGWGPLA